MAKKDEKIEKFLDEREAKENGETNADADTSENVTADASEEDQNRNIWMRGLFMVILALLFGLAETVLLAFAVLQFLWMLFSKEKNRFLADSGDTIGKWLHAVAKFQTGLTEEKPFPWRKLD